ncbi:MAG: ABC transporter permease, partial [Pseudomonadota bacterium]
MIRLEKRAEASQVMGYVSPLIAIVLMLVGGLLLFAVLGKNPIEGFKVFFIYPISDLYGVSELLLKA